MPAKTPPGTPERIEGLADLANNLGWSWNREARALFRTIDENLWHLCRHNPVAFLEEVSPARLKALGVIGVCSGLNLTSESSCQPSMLMRWSK